MQAQQDYAKANLHNELVVLTAPRDAIVLSVAKISVGSVVTSAEPLIQLVPIDAPLSVEADISGIDSGYVQPGRRGHDQVRHAALPAIRQRRAAWCARSARIVSTPKPRPRKAARRCRTGRARSTTRPTSRSTKLSLHDTPPGFRLMPGMPVTADVKVGTRSVLGYFIAKILPVAYDSMHEP